MPPHNILTRNLLGAEFRLPDPGDGGTLRADCWGAIFPVVTAGASETRILAAPTKAEQACKVVHDTDGGDFTLTVNPASGTRYGYNQACDTDIAFADAGDWAIFESIQVGDEYAWSLVAHEGTDATQTGGGTVSDQTITALAVSTLTFAGISTILKDLGVTAGVGITGAADNFASRVEKIGTLYKTTIVIDIDGLNSGGANDDIIGADGAGAAHLGQITAARCGTIFAGTLTCIETPVTGATDIDLHSAVEGTGVEDTAISALDATKLCDSGALTAGSVVPLTAFPAANEYLYLTCGTLSDNTYTAGILLIELWGK